MSFLTGYEPYYLGIDLASRWSAAVLLGPVEDEPLVECCWDFGPASKPPDPSKHFGPVSDFFYTMRRAWEDYTTEPVVVIEDVYHHAFNATAALRVQAPLHYLFWSHHIPVQLTPALTWQRYFGYKKEPGRTSKGWAKEQAAEFGYLPANPGGGKGSVDLRDALLLTRWLRETSGTGTLGTRA